MRSRSVRDKRTGEVMRDSEGRKMRGNFAGRLNEAFVDGMRSLRVLQEAIAHESGKPVEDFENAYMSENTMSSMNKTAEETFKREHGDGLLEIVGRMAGNKARYRELTSYMKAKHGLERNAVMRVRAIAEVKANKDMSDEDKAREVGRIKKRDYAGLTGLTNHRNVVAAEDEARRMVEAYEREHNTTALWTALAGIRRDFLQRRHDSGLISTEAMNEIESMYKFYVPLKGWNDDTVEDYYEYEGLYGGGLRPALLRADGRTTEADDPIANLLADCSRNIAEANRNRMKQRLLNLAMNHPTSLLRISPTWYVKQADGTWQPSYPDIKPTMTDPAAVEAAIAEHEERMEVLEAAGKARRRREGLRPGLIVPSNGVKIAHMVRVFRNGREYRIFVNGDPRAAMAVNGLLNPDAGPHGWMYKVLQTIKSYMARTLTTWNPEFVVRNLSRDFIFAGAAVYVKEDSAYNAAYRRLALVLVAKMPGLVSRWNSGTLDMSVELDRLFYEFMANGGETGFTQIYTVDSARKDIRRALARAGGGRLKRGLAGTADGIARVGAGLEFLNRCAEDLTRFAVYATSRRQGREILRSINDAKEITVNFNRKGSGAMFAQWVNFAYVFFNAGVQAAANGGRLMVRHPGKASFVVGLFLASGALMPMLSMVVSGLFGDDPDDYWLIPKWERRNNICLGRFRIPLPHELRPFYGIGEAAFSVLAGRESPEAAVKECLEGFTSIIPIDFLGNGGNMAVTLTPTAAQPLMQARENVNFFGNPIYRNSDRNADDPEWTKAYRNTHPLFVEASRMLYESSTTTDQWGIERETWRSAVSDINPAIVQHLLEGYTGGVGKTVLGGARTVSMLWDEDARSSDNVPVVRNFYRVPDERSRERVRLDAVREREEEVEESMATLRGIYQRPDFSVTENAATAAEFLDSEEGRRLQYLHGRINTRRRIVRALRHGELAPEYRTAAEGRLLELELEIAGY